MSRKLTPAQDRTRGFLHARLVDLEKRLRTDTLGRDAQYHGICDYVWPRNPGQAEYARLGEILTAGFEAWPKYSGHPVLPVPNPTGGSPTHAWIDHSRKWEGAYGELRRELLSFLIDYTRKTRKGD